MTERIELARSALRAAMQLRRHLTISREEPVNAFDIAKMSGLDVHFLDAPSLEGMLVRDPGTRIFLPSTKHRPKPRILFSCAHELGHQQFGHGTKADRYIVDGESQPEFIADEYLANSFAGHLLMPRAAVMEAMTRRGWTVHSVTPTQIFTVSNQLGVGYGALLTHLTVVMELMRSTAADKLLKYSPKSIKSDLAGEEWSGPMTVVDEHWRSVPVDIEVGELVVLPAKAGARCAILNRVRDHSDRTVYIPSRAGTAQLDLGGGPISLRIARQHYIGPFKNRYLDDPDEH